MVTRILKRASFSFLVAIMLLVFFISCNKQAAASADGSIFTSFTDIPGVTAAETDAIKELQRSGVSFNYSSLYGTESFYDEKGEIQGFSALVCKWLSTLFDITFIPGIVGWEELVTGLENGEIDFTGELTSNDERRKKYFMTDDITQRRIIKIHLLNERTLQDIAEKRPLRYAFLDGATATDIISLHEHYEFEPYFISDFAEVYKMLENGEIDVFFTESAAEAVFDFYGEVIVNTYFPIIYNPVSLSTQKPELEPVITVVQKALENGAINHLTRLYIEGRQYYLRHKLFMLLTNEEREYIKTNPVVPYAAEITNYPVSFYDSRTKQWDGIAHDIIPEIEKLTGLVFERKNSENMHWPELLGMLESGRVAMITELIPSEDRIGKFLWPGKEFFRDHFILISKSEFRDIAVNEILYIKTGVASNTAHSVLFQRWFPNHRGIFEYNNTNDALDALVRGEIDVVMTSQHQLLIMTNYRELVGYKANFVFDFYFDSTFGFNRNEEILSSIVTKAMKLIDVENISGQWLRRTYDYRVKLAHERIPFMIGAGVLAIGLIFALLLFVKKRKEGISLETLINKRTKELSENQKQLKKILGSLETESSMLQTMFDSIPDLIFCKDLNLNYTRCNKSLLKYFNLKEEDIIGKDDEKGLGLPENIANEYRKMDRSVIEEKKIYTYEEYVPAHDGTMRLFETNKVPLLLNGKITGIMGIAREITERKAMEDAAQSANKAKSEFLANMSHEIRTPMNAILGMSEILEQEKLNNRQMGFVKDISNSAHSLLDIINDILDMSKIEAGKLELHPVDFNFNQFLDNIVSMFTLVAKNKSLEFLFEIVNEIPDYLFGDDIRLRQILTNICGNAVKFTQAGHVKLLVSAVTNPKTHIADKLIFKVEDTGTGIRKEDLGGLFKAFEQADKTRNRGVVGTGLGLSICKSFVGMMGGEITVESEYGHGTAFIITLPIVKGNPDNIRKVDPGKKEQTISAPDAKILITDDNNFNLKVASGLLNFMEIIADTAESGARAIEMVKQNDYDIVFMDHMMPGMDGVVTVREIRKMGGKYKDLKIIALTANAVSGAREMFLENGFNDFISKPINAKEIREIVQKYLPSEKIRTETKVEDQKAVLDKEEQLHLKSIITFVKENRNTFEKINDSLSAGDVVTAHRIAHTLKSIAGYLGKKELQEAAFSLEKSLQNYKALHTPEQLSTLEKELSSALKEFEPLVKKAESEKPASVHANSEELAPLFAQLKPLLEKGDFGATSFLEKLQGIAGMEGLAEMIDEYNFVGALKVLNSFESKET